MSFLDKLPKPPRLDKCCFMFDLYLSVKYTTMVEIILWIVYGIGAIVGLNGGSRIWGIIWTLINCAVFGTVLYGLRQNNRTLLIPALGVCLFDVLAGAIQIIINFVTLSWFTAIWITITTGVTAYYWLALYSVFMDMGSAGSGLPQSASQDSKPPMNPA